MNKMRERHRFLRGMSVWVGFDQIGVPLPARRPLRGRDQISIAQDAAPGDQRGHRLFLFSTAARHVCRVYRRWPEHPGDPGGDHHARWQARVQFTGQATTLMAVLFLGGVQLICLGILGEYIGRLYDEAKGRPLYIVSQAPNTQPRANPGSAESERK